MNHLRPGSLIPRAPFLFPCMLALLLAWSTSESAADVWDGFASQHIDGSVYAATYFNGDLIAGGPFNSAGGTAGSRIMARWNGAHWIGLNMPGAYYTGPGAWETVEVVAVHQGQLYVGGHFLAEHGALSDHIMRWDGTNWHAMNYGVNGVVYALLSSGNDLIVGGEFISAGAVPMNRVARWDGTSWHALGSGLDWAPAALVEYGGEIVACGSTYSIGGDVATVAAWNGTNWHSLGQSLANGRVSDLEVYNGILIAAGLFDLAGGSNLAWLDGDIWKPLGGGTDGGTSALCVAGGRLYVAGGFHNVGSPAAVSASSIAVWDGEAWNALTTGVTGEDFGWGTVWDLSSNGTDVLVGGDFEFAGGLAAPNLAIWNGSAWSNAPSNYGNGLNGTPLAFLTTSDGALMVGGAFTVAGDQAANRIASWDGTWHAYGDGFNAQVNALAEFNGSVIAAGSFTLSGTQPVNRIAEWNGTSWITLGPGLDGTVNALAIYNGQLIAGGSFTTSGGQPMNRIARWDGTSWSSMGSAGTVKLLAVHPWGALFAAMSTLAQWDGSSWTYNLTGPVISMTTVGNDLIVFHSGQCLPGDCGPFLRRWNGITWTTLPEPAMGPYNMANYFGTLVGSGTLASGEMGALGYQANSWYLLAESMSIVPSNPPSSGITCLKGHDGSNVKGLFVGGDFLSIGGVPSGRIALINPEWKPTSVQETPASSRLQASPNPFKNSLAIRFTLESPSQVEVTVVDLQGRVVRKVLDRLLPAGPHDATWDARDTQGGRVPSGVYFIRVRQGDRIESQQVVLIE